MKDSLIKIRKSIMTSPAVTDTLWLEGSISETVVERIDSMLIELGLTDEEMDQLEDDGAFDEESK